MSVTALRLQTTNLPLDRFPDYTEPVEFESLEPSVIDTMTTNGVTPVNKQLKAVLGETDPSRHPSPQPTHFSVPISTNGNNGHRVLRSATVGYIAPEFKGRAEQMNAGESD
jgi:glutamate dehydrogenase